ncbi:YqfQ family protein [Metabacillus sediminilitoris]|uniref:YqfQ-like protein n=1 Tax=Metabacillus sediminilitoris TaxID=2567941 RepID=A0A4S4BZA8_9BACI|nr:YqfQ family protein [Metabacillus sediminilitoris]QGQ47295.1 hypothetical protein GMB29_19780 [Metabacillus sediminilitoris]THF80637.1 hypothetical protein E6W99_09575 [Metabacillus sediminilitoris]
MFQQRPMPPINSRGFFPQQGQIPMRRQPFQGAFRGPNMGRGQFGSQMPVRGSGGIKGLLSRIIPGGQGAGGAINSQGIIQGATGASRATGALQGLANPANISGMLGNVQKVLGMAQQVTPMVQQYGPLVKNLPAMLKIYRELKNSDSSDGETAVEDTAESAEVNTNSTTDQNITQKKQQHKEQESSLDHEQSSSQAELKSTHVGKKHTTTRKRSVPKLYI